MDKQGMRDAETYLRAVIENEEGAKGAMYRERTLGHAPIGWLQDFADSVHVLDTILARVLEKRFAQCR